MWDLDQLRALLAKHGSLVALEKSSKAHKLDAFIHPDSGLYLIGPRNGSLPREVLELGFVVEVETPSPYPLQPHVAAGIALHHRHVSMIGVTA